MAVKQPNRFALLAETNSPPQDDGWQEVQRRPNARRDTVLQERAAHKDNFPPLNPTGGLKTRVQPEHSHQRSGAPEHWCGVCKSAFPSKTTLISHAKHTPYHENYCNLCTRVFKDRNGLKNHVENTVGHEVFCNVCLSAFKDLNGLRNHYENKYMTGHKFVCLVCLMAFQNRQQLNLHLQNGEKHVWCKTCHRKFRNQEERDEHWLKTVKHKHCLQPACNFDGPTAQALRKHMLEDHWHCDVCGLIFSSQTKLNNHSCQPPRNGHLQSFEVEIDDDLESVPRKSDLDPRLSYACNHCRFQTTTEGDLQVHMTAHASPLLPCWACCLPFKTNSSLINHLESGACPLFPNPDRFMTLLGRWWYSTLYMDIGLHAQLRQGCVDLPTLNEMIQAGAVEPFTCRADGCGKHFRYLSSLVLHVESKACAWDLDRIALPMLKLSFQLEFPTPGKQ
ncbi:hypothetical protein BCR34DRAFT_625650 [Clohesyomyces aquaticus]|uniref:C2H2-type domain-containing protein n=1 Tax=Clohesyomyces aquaticus TaxID=1231657 RepID=A0A1Y1ZH50_9PLEO|nr:hypothetical protein BCR34DRAFT_625650 [Clohesyomyces aquaticus]